MPSWMRQFRSMERLAGQSLQAARNPRQTAWKWHDGFQVGIALLQPLHPEQRSHRHTARRCNLAIPRRVKFQLIFSAEQLQALRFASETLRANAVLEVNLAISVEQSIVNCSPALFAKSSSVRSERQQRMAGRSAAFGLSYLLAHCPVSCEVVAEGNEIVLQSRAQHFRSRKGVSSFIHLACYW